MHPAENKMHSAENEMRAAENPMARPGSAILKKALQ